MKVIFEINTEEPDDRHEYRDLYHASNYRQALIDMAEWLRNENKYGESDTIELQKVIDKFYEIVGDNRVPELWGE